MRPPHFLTTSITLALCLCLGAQNAETVDVRAHHLTYYTKLDENMVHVFGVKKMWSSARQDILDKMQIELDNQKASNEQKRLYIDEHDPLMKRNGRLELTRKISNLVSSETLTNVFENFPHSDQLWIVREKDAGRFTDLQPECAISDESSIHQIKCNVNFHSLQALYGAYFDFNVTLLTALLDLDEEEVEKRKKPEQGVTKPIEFSTIKIEGLVVAPEYLVKERKTGATSSLSENSMNKLVDRCNRFMAVLTPVVSIVDMGSAQLPVMDHTEWEKMMYEYEVFHRVDTKEEYFGKPEKNEEISVPPYVNIEAGLEEEECESLDERPQLVKDGLEGLDEFMGSLAEKESYMIPKLDDIPDSHDIPDLHDEL